MVDRVDEHKFSGILQELYFFFPWEVTMKHYRVAYV